MYFLMIGSEMNKTIGCSLSKWCCNKSPQLAHKIERFKLTGFTRVELRFEHQQFKTLDYYNNAIELAVESFNKSQAARIQPISYQW